MLVAPPPENEEQRLRVLRGLAILDTPPEQEYDDLVHLAAEICGTPIALFTLVDERRQWFKARVGLDQAETAREVAFCAHALHGPGILEVPSAAADPRFADNPLVTGAPHIGFYAGAPLVTEEGTALGTLCVIDQRPRTLSGEQRQALERLRRHAVKLIELRRAALALRELEEAQRQTARFREQFMGILGHDLRNPLATILAASSSLRGRRDLPQPAPELSALIHHSGDRMARMIDDLLDLTRIRLGGGMPVARRDADLHALCREAVAAFAVTAPGRVALQGQGDGRARVDPDRVAQVVTNLVGNALAYAPPGTPVRVRVIGEPGAVALQVHNEGPPIPPERVSGLFAPFLRGERPAGANPRGLGLGLFIVSSIVAAHEGSVEVSPAEGGGTTFTARFPR